MTVNMWSDCCGMATDVLAMKTLSLDLQLDISQSSIILKDLSEVQ